MEKFWVYKKWDTEYLKRVTFGYYHTEYLGYKKEGNPDFIVDLKNTNQSTKLGDLLKLERAKKLAIGCFLKDLPQVISLENLINPICICVPRSKAYMLSIELFFSYSVKEACAALNIEDGTDVIRRVKHTCTTHLGIDSSKNDDGSPMPYPGITVDTCEIDVERIKGRDVILIDDVYTPGVNIDEDCIQTLWNAGAKKVVLYVIGFTKGRA